MVEVLPPARHNSQAMTKRQPEDDLPRLAIVFSAQLLVLQVFEAGAGARRIIWLVDRSIAEADASLRLLGRVGTVIDITGLNIDESADLLAAHEPDGILAFAERELMRAALIGERLGLPVQTPDTVTRLTNKAAQRRALADAGLPVPQFWPVPAGSDSATRTEISRAVRYPAIVKPQHGAGSRDAHRVLDAEDLSRVLERSDPDRIGDLIVEELLPDSWPRDERPYADFVSVESIVTRGQISHLAVSGRAALVEPFRETGNFIPSNLPAHVTSELIDVAGRAVMAMGASAGVFHTEVKITPRGPYVIEVNGRLGGSIPEIFALATGGAHSLLDIACRVALGEDMRFAELVPCRRVGYSIIVPPPLSATRVLRLDHLDEVRRIPGVDTLIVDRQAGDTVDWRQGWDGRLYAVYGVADDHDAMWAARRRVDETVDAEFA